MTELYSEGRQPNKETAEEILKRLEALNNYIPPSEAIRREYRHLLLKEYREYVESRTGDSPKEPSGPG